MKSNLTKVSLALLSAVFILGCQDLGSGPVEAWDLGPQFALDCDAKPNHPQCGPRVFPYKVTFAAGDLTTDPATASGDGATGGQVGFAGCCQGGKLVLLSALLFDVGDAAVLCFGDASNPLTIEENWWGRLTPDKKDMNQVEARFAFNAKDKDGINPVRYKLIIAPGTAVDLANANAVFPPEEGTSMTVKYSEGMLFKINAHRKKEKNACSSDGFIPLKNDISVEVKAENHTRL